MARTKAINAVTTYVNTPYIVNDKGADKSPRFELYNTETSTIVQKSNNPTDFDTYMYKNVYRRKRDV